MHAPAALFKDREAAGREQAGDLERFRGTDAVVLGIARGGMVVAALIAECLALPLDVIVVRKIVLPGWPELALGAVTSDGGVFVNESQTAATGGLRFAIGRAAAAARELEATLRGFGTPLPIAGRPAIIVDDGWATGASARAAIRSVRQRNPSRLVVAAPVGSQEACQALMAEADEVVCPHRPCPFGAVAVHYASFNPVSEVEVRALMRSSQAAESRRTGSDRFRSRVATASGPFP